MHTRGEVVALLTHARRIELQTGADFEPCALANPEQPTEFEPMFSQSALSSSNSYRGAKARRCNPPRGSAGGKRAAPNNDDPNPLA